MRAFDYIKAPIIPAVVDMDAQYDMTAVSWASNHVAGLLCPEQDGIPDGSGADKQ
jgi:hypothetical protein